jgi:hypothetical protein
VKASTLQTVEDQLPNVLASERPGRLVSGGKHPKWATPDGLKVPIPTGELAHGTARAILKGLGVLSRYGSVDRFMSSDAA